MRIQSLLGLSVLTLVAAASSGCGVRLLRTPTNVSDAQPIKIEGYSSKSRSFDNGVLKIGSYAVNNVDRDWQKGSGVEAGPFSKEKKKNAYRYDITAQARTLHGECTEEQVAKGVAGFGSTHVTFGCACTEGEKQVSKIDVVDGAGTVQVGEGVTYNVTSLNDVEGGGTSNSALGYQFQGPQGLGVVDVSGTGRAWVPANSAEDDTFGLACSYAGLLLYRPASGSMF
ncbi:MAG: hypothetical protein QM778_02215 [Myxococcales bacterium]